MSAAAAAPEPRPVAPSRGDPRPDLWADHDLWCLLLAHADAHDGGGSAGVSGVLRGLRAEGAALIFQAGELRIERGEMAPVEYGVGRKELAPYADIVGDLLAAVVGEVS